MRTRPVPLLLLLIFLLGCGSEPSEKPAEATNTLSDVPDKQLQEMVDDALRHTFNERQLNLDVNAAWQILHGALPFGMKFNVQNGDASVPAMQWVDPKTWQQRSARRTSGFKNGDGTRHQNWTRP